MAIVIRQFSLLALAWLACNLACNKGPTTTSVEVDTTEIIPELGERARARLSELGYSNVHVRIGDGNKGWPERAPFDRILVTAAPRDLPRALLEQLGEGGILVAPIGPANDTQ